MLTITDRRNSNEHHPGGIQPVILTEITVAKNGNDEHNRQRKCPCSYSLQRCFHCRLPINFNQVLALLFSETQKIVFLESLDRHLFVESKSSIHDFRTKNFLSGANMPEQPLPTFPWNSLEINHPGIS